MSDGLGVVIAILVLLDIGLHLWGLWPDTTDDDLDASNPIGFEPYDPEEHWDEDESPWEVP